MNNKRIKKLRSFARSQGMPDSHFKLLRKILQRRGITELGEQLAAIEHWVNHVKQEAERIRSK